MDGFKVRVDAMANLFINDTFISTSVLNHIVNCLNNPDKQGWLSFIPEKFHGLVNKPVHFFFGGFDDAEELEGLLSNDAIHQVEEIVDEGSQCDIVIVYPDKTFSANFHEPEKGFNLLCEFLLWHEELIITDSYSGLEPFVFWELSSILKSNTVDTVFPKLPDEFEQFGVFDMRDSFFTQNGMKLV